MKKNSRLVVIMVAIILMSIPIALCFYAMVTNKVVYSDNVIISALQHAPLINKYIKPGKTSPFNEYTGLASLYAVVLYTIVLIRNKNTLVQFDINRIDIGAIILHFFDLMFLVTLCLLISNNQFNFFGLDFNKLMIIGIILTFFGMRSLSGFVWIIISLISLSNIIEFDKWKYAVPYIIPAYLSIVLQVLILNIFQFDLSELKNDFIKVGNNVGGDVQRSIEVTQNFSTKALKVASSGRINLNKNKKNKLILENN